MNWVYEAWTRTRSRAYCRALDAAGLRPPGYGRDRALLRWEMPPDGTVSGGRPVAPNVSPWCGQRPATPTCLSGPAYVQPEIYARREQGGWPLRPSPRMRLQYRRGIITDDAPIALDSVAGPMWAPSRKLIKTLLLEACREGCLRVAHQHRGGRGARSLGQLRHPRRDDGQPHLGCKVGRSGTAARFIMPG